MFCLCEDLFFRKFFSVSRSGMKTHNGCVNTRKPAGAPGINPPLLPLKHHREPQPGASVGFQKKFGSFRLWKWNLNGKGPVEVPGGASTGGGGFIPGAPAGFRVSTQPLWVFVPLPKLFSFLRPRLRPFRLFFCRFEDFFRIFCICF
jgi:hypothetical protein